MSPVLPSGIPARGERACGGDALPGASERGQTFAGSAAVAAAVLAQAVALAWLADAGGAVPAGVLAAGACSFAWHRRAHLAHVDVVIATAAFGGLGMMAGEWIARSVSATAHHAGMAHGPGAPGAWMVAAAVMLLTCAAACRWTCAPLCRGGWRRRTAAHVLAAGGMLAGMAAAGAVLAAPLGSVLGAAAGAHLAMVLGMTAGVAAVLPLIGMMDPRPRVLQISR